MEEIKKIKNLLTISLAVLLSTSSCSMNNTKQSNITITSLSLDNIKLLLLRDGICISTPQNIMFLNNNDVIKEYSLSFLKDYFPNIPIDNNLTDNEIDNIWKYLNFDSYDDNDISTLNKMKGYTSIDTTIYLCYDEERGYYYDNNSNNSIKSGNLIEMFNPNIEEFIITESSKDKEGNDITMKYISNFDLHLFEIDSIYGIKNKQLVKKN